VVVGLLPFEGVASSFIKREPLLIVITKEDNKSVAKILVAAMLSPQ
jgi:hypothetical protein